jgi:parallel beta-helix repeat protein
MVLVLAAAAVACDDPTGISLRGDYFVSAASGSDTYDGSSGAPFKTITKALSVADSGDTIIVAPGRYDAALGETFPLVIPDWVELIGDEPNKGGGTTPTLIFGGGPTDGTIHTAIEPGAHVTIAGFSIRDSTPPVPNPTGILVRRDGVTIRNNRLVDNGEFGMIASDSAAGGVVAGNVIAGNGTAGIGFIGGGVSSRVENNTITGNNFGVYYDGTGGDLGGGASASAGGNTLSCNTTNDVYADAAVAIAAASNRWDHAPPTTGAAGDIWDDAGGATVTATGATLATAACT